MVLSDLSLAEQKTKVVVGVLKALKLTRQPAPQPSTDPAVKTPKAEKQQTVLLAIKEHDPTLWKCSRNIDSLWVSPVSDLNAYDLLHQKRLVITRDAMDAFRARGRAVEPAAVEAGV